MLSHLQFDSFKPQSDVLVQGCSFSIYEVDVLAIAYWKHFSNASKNAVFAKCVCRTHHPYCTRDQRTLSPLVRRCWQECGLSLILLWLLAAFQDTGPGRVETSASCLSGPHERMPAMYNTEFTSLSFWESSPPDIATHMEGLLELPFYCVQTFMQVQFEMSHRTRYLQILAFCSGCCCLL
jgi:hypothetical protein